MPEVEEYIVEITTLLAKMWVPISQCEELKLANSLIQDTSVEVKVQQWRQQYCAAHQGQRKKIAIRIQVLVWLHEATMITGSKQRRV